jgi:hypothetical protein
MTENMTLHAHVSTHSQDCDGPMYRDYIEQPNDDERAEFAAGEARGYNNFADLSFQARILSGHVSFHSEYGVQVKMDKEGFVATEMTDEGFRNSEVRWCVDSGCDPNESWQRDVFAEQMGY